MIFSKILRQNFIQKKLFVLRYPIFTCKVERCFSTKENERVVKQRVLKPTKQQQSDSFKFDSENKTPIFEHMQGEIPKIHLYSNVKRDLKIAVRVLSAFTIVNGFLAFSEFMFPIFGGWNGVTFSVCSFVGLGLLTLLSEYSKKSVHSMRLLKSGDFVEIKFFNAFWIPKTKLIHVSEFSNLRSVFAGYSNFNIQTQGKIWIDLDNNKFFGDKVYDDLLKEILNGKQIKLDQNILQRAAQYKKMK